MVREELPDKATEAIDKTVGYIEKKQQVPKEIEMNLILIFAEKILNSRSVYIVINDFLRQFM